MEKAIFDEFVERVLAAGDIIAVVSGYVSLKKKGKNFWGCCPFHHEKTPSFSVSPDKGLFYCFGCQAGGNAITFVSMMESISRYEAIKLLAQRHNIPLPEREKTPEELAREKERNSLLQVQGLAGDFFYACLTKTGYGKQAKAYFMKRGVDQGTIDEFKLGFAPDAWDKLSVAFQKRGIDNSLLVQAGLAVEKKHGGLYDRFRNRIIFPIIDERGRTIGFGGRVMDDSQPKYLNSPETMIFNKRNVLFGLYAARQFIKKAQCAIIVEGYMDALAAHQFGFKNVVASLGTAFTERQAKKLLQYAPKIIFAYDSDAAGQNATLRALSIVKSLGAEVRVISVPDGKDPDEFIRKHGSTAFQELIDHAVPLIRYQIDRALSEIDCASLEGKVAVVARVVPVLAETNNAVEADAYIREISQTLAIDESAIRSEMKKYLPSQKQDKNVKIGQDIKVNTMERRVDPAVFSAGRHIIRLLCSDSAMLPYIQAQLGFEAFPNLEQQEIFRFLCDRQVAGETISEAVAAAYLSEAAIVEFSRCLLSGGEEEDALKLLDDCIKTLRLAQLKALYEKHRLRADELQRRGESFLQELAESQRIKYEIDKMYE